MPTAPAATHVSPAAPSMPTAPATTHVSPAGPSMPTAPATVSSSPVPPSIPAPATSPVPAKPMESAPSMPTAPAATHVSPAAPSMPTAPATVSSSPVPPSIPSPATSPVPAMAPAVPSMPTQPALPATPAAVVQKPQVFHERPKVQATADQIAQAANALIKNQKIQEEQKKQDNEYTRRAAANLVKRLQQNPNRVQGMQSLKDMVFNDAKKADLITLLVENGGDLGKVQCHLQLMEESGQINIARKKALRYTKKQMQDMYGEDAEKVMKHKEATGMTEDDENMPDVKLYLVAQREDEFEDFTRNSILESKFERIENPHMFNGLFNFDSKMIHVFFIQYSKTFLFNISRFFIPKIIHMFWIFFKPPEGKCVATQKMQVDEQNAQDVREIMLFARIFMVRNFFTFFIFFAQCISYTILNFNCEILRKPATPKPGMKRALGSEGTPSPTTPVTPAPMTPADSVQGEPKKKPRRSTKNAEEVTPLTPLQKAKDMCTKLLKKKNDASNLNLTLESLPYGEALSKEMAKFALSFECFG